MAFPQLKLSRATKAFRSRASASPSVAEEVRRLVSAHGRLTIPADRLGDEDNLFAAGLRSFAAVQLVIAVEDAFGVELDILDKESFETIGSIARSISKSATQAR